MKKTVLMILCVLLAAGGLFAGGSGEGAQKIIANIASTYPPDSPPDKGMNKFKQVAAELSGGNIDILIHASSAMGDENQTFEQVSEGSVEYGANGMGHISTFFPRYDMSTIPYLFSGVEDFWKFWNGPGKEIDDIIEKEREVRTVGIMLRGARYVTANKPIRTVAEVKGLKLRLPPVMLWIRCWEALGAIPANVAFAETYMALRTGVVEAQENPPETILAYKFYETQKYLIATEHLYAPCIMLLSTKWWNTLSKANQDILTKAMDEGLAYGNELTKNGDAEFVKQLQDLGMTLIQVDKSQFKAAIQPVIDQMAKTEWDPTIYEKVKAALR